MSKRNYQEKGFTLLEITLAIAILAVLISVVITSINPLKQLADARNGQRKTDTLSLLNAVFQYSTDHNGSFPPTIQTVVANYQDTPTTCDTNISNLVGTNEICKSTATSCNTPQIDLSKYIASSTPPYYITTIPVDPQATSTGDGTGYYIAKLNGNRILVCAKLTENDVGTIGAVH